MDTDTMMKPRVHQGRNIKRFRDIMGVKQETLAFELNLTQQAVSKLEQKEEIEDETLNKVADVLKIPVEAFKNMTDEGVINIVANTFQDSSVYGHNRGPNYDCTFNPIEKIVELYERMLALEREKNK